MELTLDFHHSCEVYSEEQYDPLSIMIQPTDAVELCDFDLVNDARWKAMSEDAVKSVCGRGVGSTWSSLPALCPSSLDAGLVSNDLEQQLRALILQHRMVSLGFLWPLVRS